jgi:hypothetical protein
MRKALLIAIFIGLAGCGKGAPDLPAAPQLITDRQSLGFGQENGSGTYVGTSASNSIQLINQGMDDLVIQSVDLSGDDAFTMEGPDVDTVISGTSALVTIYFTPPSADTFTATLTITSNAENAPTKEVTITGLGIDPP